MNFRRALNLFPWDVQSEGAASCLGAIAELGCSTVVLSTNYHRARLFRPRTLGYYNRPVDWCDFTPMLSLYEEPALLPPVNPDSRCVAATRDAVTAARAEKLEVIASIIGCHNTTIGLAHPELCIENAFGDRYSFALCPAQPRVRAHLCSLVRDVSRQLRPDAVLIDSFAYLDAVHREHHELMFVSPGAFGKYLLSLCFCPACWERLAHEGVDPEAFRTQVKALIASAVARDAQPRSAEWERDELTALLLEMPEVMAATRARGAAVAELLRQVRQVARGEKVALHVQTGLLARPSARAWTEGPGLRTMAEFTDHLFVQAHFASAREVAQDLGWAATLIPPERLVMASMAGEDHVASEGDLRQRVQMAHALGAAGACFYNYGLLSPERLAWIRRALSVPQRAEGGALLPEPARRHGALPRQAGRSAAANAG